MARDYASELARLKQQIKEVQKGQRYAHGGSIEDAALEVRDGAGSLRTILGVQGDGTVGVNVVNGPIPPAPAAPSVEPALAALAITWDGTFAGAQAAPLDWMRVEVHVGPNPTFTPDQGTLRGTIESPQGGTVTVPLPYTEWYVRLRSRTTSGVASAATDAVAATPRKAGTQDLTAGAVTADTIAVDALTGKTITGGTITGAQIQTAASGQRITLNEEDANKVIVYNSSGTAIGELSTRGLIVQGTNGASLWLDPNNVFPNLRLTNATGTNSAVINVSGANAVLGLNSGTSTVSGATWKWRTLFGIDSGLDFWAAERVRNDSNTIYNGGRIYLTPTSGTFGWRNAADSSQDAYLHASQGLVQLTGNTNVTGMLTAANMAYGRVVITPSAANAPTSATVTYARLTGTDYEGYACASTAVPGMTVTGVAMNNITPTSATVWCTRTNLTATGVSWQVIGR